MNKKFIPDEKFDKKLKTLFHSDKTLRQICKKLNISKGQLYREIHRLNLKRLPRVHYKFISAYKILELKKSGLSYSKIAEKLNVHPGTLLSRRRNLGIYDWESYDSLRYKNVPNHQNKPKILSFPIDSSSCLTKHSKEIEKLLNSGMSKIKIARKFNVALSTLWRFLYLKKINIPVSRKLDGKEEKIIRLFNAGMSFENMALELKCHSDTLSRKIKKMGLTRKTPRQVSQLDKHKEKIEKLFNDGFTYIQIAEIFRVHPSTMMDKIRQLNLIKGPRIERCDSATYGKTNKILELRTQGLTFHEMSKILGIKENAIAARYRILVKKGVLKDK